MPNTHLTYDIDGDFWKEHQDEDAACEFARNESLEHDCEVEVYLDNGPYKAPTFITRYSNGDAVK